MVYFGIEAYIKSDQPKLTYNKPNPYALRDYMAV